MRGFWGLRVPAQQPWQSPETRGFRRARWVVLVLGGVTGAAAFAELWLEEVFGWRKMPGGSLWVFGAMAGAQCAIMAGQLGSQRYVREAWLTLRWPRIYCGAAGALVLISLAVAGFKVPPSYLLWRMMLAALCGGTALAMGPLIRQFVLRARAEDQRSCPECGYDLYATPERCPECGWTSDGGWSL